MRIKSRAELTVLVVITVVMFAVVITSTNRVAYADIVNPPTSQGPDNEFHLARLYYKPNGLHPWHPPGRPWWRIDWPEAEEHLTAAIARYTRVDSYRDSVHVSLTDDAIFDYPFLFAQQIGRWMLDSQEIAQLGEYLLRGGFMLGDDIHGPDQWRTVLSVFSRALPGYQIEEIDPDATSLAVVFPVEQLTQIPGRRHIVGLNQDGSAEVRMPHKPQQWMGIHDNDGRLMVAFNINMDMGDAWEHADDAGYPNAMTALAYKLGINYIIHAMTH